ncbi:MAG: hypothetical protein KME31_19850 [Tolypothrix carrinoi HA7290-LM1]|jgi:hypothetical protein|nr:hypothetical protein [Tolypothrix carrinoi HA7290-LM1]
MFSTFSRRQILSLISFVGIGVVAGSLTFVGKLSTSKAQTQEISEEVYKGRKYKIVTDITPQAPTARDTTFETQTQLFLDGKRVKIARNIQTQKYMTPLLFGQFNSPEEVAKILIDLGIKLPDPGEVQIDSNLD